MEKNEQLEQLLKLALSSTAEPDNNINQKIKSKINEVKITPAVKRRTAAILVAAAIVIMSVSAFAAWQYLSPNQVAKHLGDDALAEAFNSENAININKSATCGDYIFTLLGITSGTNLSSIKTSSQDMNQDINPDKTYAVVSIARKDGNPLPELKDNFYFENGFIVTPLIKGLNPWEVNIFSMNGGAIECLIDGIIYRMIECDSIEMFADRGVYLYVGTGRFLNNSKIIYYEETGEITLNPDNEEAGVLFDLPLDKSKADPEKAEQYLKELLGKNSNEEESQSSEEDSDDYEYNDWDEEFDNGIVIPESIKEVTINEKGFAIYEYKDSNRKSNAGASLDYLLNHKFKDTEPGVWKTISIFGDGDNEIAIQFSIDENGVLMGRAVKKAN